MKILWLASWYPSAIEPFNGDFVQRHAEAVSLFHDVTVLHVIKDSKGILTKDIKIVSVKRGRLTEIIVYYNHPLQNLPVAGRFFSQLKYRAVFKNQIREYIRTNGKPPLVHLHVGMNAGPLALWMKKEYGLPYVLTEHSSQFLPEADKQLKNFSVYYRMAVRKVLEGAAAISAVSQHLRSALETFAPGKKHMVIPNVVNTQIFRPAEKRKSQVIRFLHVSSLDSNKNPEGILTACSILKKTYTNFFLDVFGPPKQDLQKMTSELGLQNHVEFHEEVSQAELAAYMQNADALLLFSRYETFGCVVIEANACGTPVIVSDISAMHEIVQETVNGLIVQSSPEALAGAMQLVLENRVEFVPDIIVVQAREKYSYATVGESFSKLYQSIYASAEG